MNNKVNFAATIDAIYALSSLKAIINDPTLPGPLGRDDEEALYALTQRVFGEICAELGATPDGESVELNADCHELLQAVVTDRTVAELCLRAPRGELMHRLRCRLRTLPPKSAKRY